MKDILKYLTIIIVSALVFTACNKERTTYDIYGVVEDMEDGLVVKLGNAQTYEIIDSTNVKNGHFHFHGNVEKAHFANLYFGRMYHPFVLENAEYKAIKGKYYNTVEGGEINNKVFGYTFEKGYQEMRKEHALATNPFEGIDMMDKEAVEKARKISDKRMRKEWGYKTDYQRKVLEDEYSTLIKLFTLCDISDWDNYGYDKQLELFEEYEKEVGAHPLLVKTREGILRAKRTQEIQKSVAAGKPFKEVIGETKDGEELKLSDVVAKNKYTLLEMWASWCGPCRGEFPHLKKAYGHYNKKGFEIFALSLDEKEKAWLKAMEEENVPWINVVDYNGFEGNGAQDYAVRGIPSSFLIAQNGKIVAVGQDVRGFALDEKLEELLGNN